MGNQSVTRKGYIHLPLRRGLREVTHLPKQYNKATHFRGRTSDKLNGESMKPTLDESFSTSRAEQDFRSSLAEYVRTQALPVDKLGHQPRLYAITQLVGKGLAYDDDVVFAAAWLHDLGVFIGHRPEDLAALVAWDNVRYAMEQAPAIL